MSDPNALPPPPPPPPDRPAPAAPVGECPRCGAPLDGALADGQCGACVLDLALDETGEPDEEPHAPRTFGPYTLVAEIGRGGMGVVWKAWDPRLRRHVALKLLLGGIFASPEFARRFREEAALAAGLQHPGLVTVHDAGEHDGQAFFTMELIHGRSLADILRAGPVAAESAALWLRAVAEAVAHAHHHGVVHRDLKPSNILINDHGHPCVADFGLARLRDAHPGLTRTVDTAGSPPYMAPEQIGSTGGGDGVAIDVYALGAVLYHLLTGRPPFQGETVAQLLAQLTECAPVPPRSLVAGLPRDLEILCLKCLEKEPRRRYPTARELADDLTRFLEGRPVMARPVSAVGRAWRWAKRRPTAAALTAALVASWAAGTVLVVKQAAANRRMSSHLADERYALNVAAAARVFFRGGGEEGPGDSSETRRLLEMARPPQGEPDRRGFEWHWLWHESRPRQSQILGTHQGYLHTLAASPGGRWLASSGFDDRTLLWPTEGAIDEARLLAPVFSESLAFPPGDRDLLLVDRSPDGTRIVTRRDLATGENVESLMPARQFSLSADGTRLATVSVTGVFFEARNSGEVHVWDYPARRRLWEKVPAPACRAALNADGTRLATADPTGAVFLWDVVGQRLIHTWQPIRPSGAPVLSLAFAPTGDLLAAGGSGTVRLWSSQSPDLPPTTLPHPASHDVISLAFSNDGTRLVTAATDHGLRLWSNLASPTPSPFLLRGHTDEVWATAWPAGGERVFSGGKDPRLLAWPTDNAAHLTLIPSLAWAPPIFSPDSQHILTTHREDAVLSPALWNLAGRRLRTFPDGGEPLQFCDGGRSALVRRAGDYTLEWWPLDADTPSRRLSVPNTTVFTHPFQAGLTTDEKTVFIVDNHGQLSLLDAHTALPRQTLPAVPEPMGEIRGVAQSPDSRWFALGGTAAPYHLWICDPASRRVFPLTGHTDEINGLAFSRDGRWLASASTDHSVRIWDVATWSCAQVLAGHPRGANGVAFAPDGRTLATVGAHQSLKFWHTTTWHEIASLELPDAGTHLSFTHHGQSLGVAWEPGQRVSAIRLFTAPIPSATEPIPPTPESSTPPSNRHQ